MPCDKLTGGTKGAKPSSPKNQTRVNPGPLTDLITDRGDGQTSGKG